MPDVPDLSTLQATLDRLLLGLSALTTTTQRRIADTFRALMIHRVGCKVTLKFRVSLHIIGN